MNSIESTMLECLRNCRPLSRGNTKVVVTGDRCGYVTLFGNTIATFDDLIITLIDGGWRTKTTKSRLNALLSGTKYRIAATDFEWRLTYLGKDRGYFKNNTHFYIGDSK